MEAIAAVGFAANILQFIEYIYGLVSKAKGTYQSISGTSAKNLELKLVAESLRELSEKLMRSEEDAQDEGVSQNATINKIAASTREISRELVSVLDRLRIHDGPHRKWRTFRHALDSIWQRPRITELQSQLEDLRNQLSIQIVAEIRYKPPI
jgi:hypothetical protein